MLQNLYGAKGPALTQAELNPILALHERFAMCQGGKRALLKGANLNDLSLANRNLTEADFSGASLVRANLFGSNLTRASLYCADMRGCNLRNTILTNADLRGASFKGAVLSYAKLDFADLRAAMMMYTGAEGTTIVDRGDLNKPTDGEKAGVDFSNCSMRNVSFGHAKLDRANFSGALLTGTKFAGATLTNATFRGAVLMGVNLKEIPIPPEELVDCVLDITAQGMAKAAGLLARIETHSTWIASEGKQGALAVFDGEDLRPLCKQIVGRSLIGLSARNCLAIGVDFSGCQLQGAKFDGADLRDANFTGANLSGVSMKRAKLGHARFDDAKLLNIQLLNGETLPPDLTDAEATEEQFQHASLDRSLSTLGLSHVSLV